MAFTYGGSSTPANSFIYGGSSKPTVSQNQLLSMYSFGQSPNAAPQINTAISRGAVVPSVLGLSTEKTDTTTTAPKTTAPAPTPNPTPTPQPTQDTSEVDNVYNDAYNVLSQQEANLRAQQPNIEQQYISQYESQRPYIEQAKAAMTGQINQATEKAGTQKESALAAARRLFNEQQMGFQQRFGGSSSAGLAANQINSREAQRQFGQVQQSYGDTLSALNQKSIEAENQYQTQLQDLNSKKEMALAQARAEFQNRLSSINDARFGLSQNKAAAKLQLLQEFRNRAYQIQSEADQFQRQLELIRAQSAAQLQAQQQAISQYQSQFGPAVNNTVNNMNTTAMGAVTPLSQTTQATGNDQILGYLNPTLRKNYLQSTFGLQ